MVNPLMFTNGKLGQFHSTTVRLQAVFGLVFYDIDAQFHIIQIYTYIWHTITLTSDPFFEDKEFT